MSILQSRFYVVILVIIVFNACTNTEKEVEVPIQRPASVVDVLPYTQNDQHIIFQATLQDTLPARLIFDTNAGLALYLDSTFITQHNWLKSPDAAPDSLKHSNPRVKFIREANFLDERPVKFQIGNTTHEQKKTGIFNLKRVLGNTADGIVGNDFMSKYTVEIDYDAKSLILHNPNTFVVPKNYVAIPITFNTAKHMYLNVTYALQNGTSFTEKTKLDLGDGGSVITINDAYILKEYKLLQNVSNLKESKSTTSLLGTFSTVVGNIHAISIGPITIDTPKVRILTSDRAHNKPIKGGGMVLVGNYIFSKLGSLIIDYKKEVVYLPVGGK